MCMWRHTCIKKKVETKIDHFNKRLFLPMYWKEPSGLFPLGDKCQLLVLTVSKNSFINIIRGLYQAGSVCMTSKPDQLKFQ